METFEKRRIKRMGGEYALNTHNRAADTGVSIRTSENTKLSPLFSINKMGGKDGRNNIKDKRTGKGSRNNI